MKALGKIVIVKHLDSKPQSSLLEIPETASGTRIGPVKATVVGIGTKSEHRHDLLPGYTVLVPFHLGTRIQDGLIIYDDEDVLAKICES